MKISIKLDRRKKGETDKGFPIVVRVDGKLQRTGQYSKPIHWNQHLAVPNSKHPDYYFLLDYIDILKTKINKVQLENVRKGVSSSQVLRIIFSKSSDIFINVVRFELGEYDGSSKWSAVRAFDKIYPEIETSRIDREIVRDFIKARIKNGNSPAGVDSYIRSLRSLWNVLPNMPENNPFSSHKIELPDKINKVPTDEDLKLLRNADLSYNGIIGSYGMYRDYFLLMFYLGGVDLEVLARLRYDQHIISGRAIFRRDKGNSKSSCNVLVPEQAMSILKNYREEGSNYLVPIHRAASYKNFRDRFRRRFATVCERSGLSVKLGTKGARYAFIDRAQQLLIDERLTAQIVGHKRRTVTSLYTNDFPLSVQDKAHLKIISF